MKNIQPRNIRILIIDDNLSDSGLQNLRTMPFEICEYLDSPTIESWKQTLELLQYLKITSEKINSPDILLVDCDFKEDTPQSPIIETVIDARGLLYGTALLPFFMAQHPYKPIACQIYTQEINRVASDGYMQTFYSLLTTLTDDVTKDYSQENIENIIKENSDTTEIKEPLLIILPIYRNKLEKAILEKRHIFPDRESFKDCAKEIERIIEEDDDVADDMAIEYWTLANQYDAINLNSLIFDCKTEEARKIEWNSEKLLEIKASFEKIANHGFIESIYKPIVERIKHNNIDFERSDNKKLCIIDEQKMFWFLLEVAKNEYEVKSGIRNGRASAAYLIPFGSSDYNDTKRILNKFFVNKEKTTAQFIDDFRDENKQIPSCLAEYKKYIVKYLKEEKGYNNEAFIPNKILN